MPAHQSLWTDDRDDVQDRREPPVELDKESAIGVHQLGPSLCLAPQDDQLLPKCRILSLEPKFRCEIRMAQAKQANATISPE
jgi:hypothetical protein